MHAELILRPDSMSLLPPMALEVELLELFAPTRPTASIDTMLRQNEHSRLWRADAIHRAKNMAQLSMSFAQVAGHPSRRWLPTEVAAQARRLSHAYNELAVDDGTKAPVPCAALLTEIASRLADIFGRSRHVSISISVEPVLLHAGARRALLLMCSELVINALKYGYPNETGGAVLVNLADRDGKIELIVEDDGVGNVEAYLAGHGGGLLEQLSRILDATVIRAAGGSGHGFRVSIVIPKTILRDGGI